MVKQVGRKPNNDILVLAAKAGESIQFERLKEKLERVADSVSRALFSDPTIKEDMKQSSLSKAFDWLSTDSPLNKDHPWSYIRRIVSNELLDLAKTRKEEGVSLGCKLSYGKTIRKAMLSIT